MRLSPIPIWGAKHETLHHHGVGKELYVSHSGLAWQELRLNKLCPCLAKAEAAVSVSPVSNVIGLDNIL